MGENGFSTGRTGPLLLFVQGEAAWVGALWLVGPSIRIGSPVPYTALSALLWWRRARALVEKGLDLVGLRRA